MQQNQILKKATCVDRPKFDKKVDLANLKSNADKLDIDKLKNVPTNLSNLKSKVDKLYVDKLVPGPVKNDIVIKMYIMIRSKILKMKYLILLTLLLILLLMLKQMRLKEKHLVLLT